MPDTIYTLLTREFNTGRRRAILSSGQAVVLHRLAIMSKDGDWIIKDDRESTNHILRVLKSRKAVYRFGAPLDQDWLKNGWSSHLEFSYKGLRVRTDFVSRPPRLSESDLSKLWRISARKRLPFVDAVALAKLKMTMREKDYPVIGELARRMPALEHQALFSRSARDLIQLAAAAPKIVSAASRQRPLLGLLGQGREAIERALDEERRSLIRADEVRMAAYAKAAEPWGRKWPGVARKIRNLPLLQAHALVVHHARDALPTVVGF
jgi:hypothetical protein